MNNIPEDSSNSNLVYFKCIPISSTDVERNCSRFKNIFGENRCVFSFEIVSNSLLVNCNTSSNS